MGRSRSIDTSHKEYQNLEAFKALELEEIQEREQLFAITCEECGTIFNSKIKLAKFCGTCNTVANALYVWYMVLAQKWGMYVAKPNPIVERVFNEQVKPIKRLTNV